VVNRYNIRTFRLFQIHKINNYTPQKLILKNAIIFSKVLTLHNTSGGFKFFFLNRFILYFLENFFKSNIVFNLKRGSTKLSIGRIDPRLFSVKFFKKNLGVGVHIISILYYTFLLKDVEIFTTFFKKVAENINLKLHKKLFLGLRKLIKSIFKPLFPLLAISGIFFNIAGKIGASGSVKKKRYFFFFGKHSLTTKTLRFNSKQTYI